VIEPNASLGRLYIRLVRRPALAMGAATPQVGGPRTNTMRDSASDPIDDLLVMQAQDGDRKSMEELVRRWQRRLWAHAYRLTGTSDAAWDVTQEAWMAIILYYVEGLSVSELAFALRTAEGTVKSRLHAARAEFRELWHRESGGTR
jgi:DNA-directed RNA polymerase specialized sigma24 family protein